MLHSQFYENFCKIASFEDFLRIFSVFLVLIQTLCKDYITEYKCNHCTKSFGAEANLKRHMKAHFHAVTPYRCTECGKYLSRADKLEKHMESYHGPSAHLKQFGEMPGKFEATKKTPWKKFHCPFCEKFFVQKELVQQHIKYVHHKQVYKKSSGGKGRADIRDFYDTFGS